ncbi:MAG: translation initiation factor IF-2 [Verrucomicrobia bacterium]|nr:translation initiation factor IF-2 [Verrucomicrobiota bacterium]MDA1086219.1 translation initiation factor IF-2 [Verrucomicrobiota bacterium]
MRVHELAKELAISSKELIAKLHDLGIEVKNHMSSIDSDVAERFRGNAAPGIKPEAAPLATAAKEPATPDPQPAPAAKKSAAPKPAPDPKPAPAAKKPAAPKPAPRPAPSPQVVIPTDIAPLNGGHEEGVSVEGKTVHTRGPIIVKDLALALKLRPNQLITELMNMNILASINERLDIKITTAICEKHGFTLEYHRRVVDHDAPSTKKLVEQTEDDDRPEDLQPRPPVVAFLGHVDHGKTSLLDKIRDTAVATGEAGGITQHIGASTLELPGTQITFLDTPGHEAFTAMRARGANLTDIAVIVVAADDGIMPQTREAIQHAQAAEVAIVIAINKMDLPAADPDKVRQQLQQMNLAPEEWGGETICCEVSAMTGDGIDHLLEMLALQAEVLELKANPSRRGQGYVIEAQLEKGMGPTVNMLVTGGTLAVGDAIYCAPFWGRAKALINDKGIKVKSVGPSIPVRVLGLCGVPEPGTVFQVYENERAAKSTAEREQEQRKRDSLTGPARGSSAEDLFQNLKEGEKVSLKVVLKSDVQGTLEAIEQALTDIKSDKITLNIILTGTGNITNNDVMLASASGALIIGFNVGIEAEVNKVAKQHDVTINLHSVIYELIDEVRRLMLGLLSPLIQEHVTGAAEIKQVFQISKGSRIAGCMVTSGTIGTGKRTRIRHNGEIIFTGGLASLRRFQDEAREVREGQECGIRLENFSSYAEGDTIEFFDVSEVAQTL